MTKKVLWHLPFAMIGGAETLYAVILKFIDKTNLQHYISCHEHIKGWVAAKFRHNAKVISWSNGEDLAQQIQIVRPDIIIGTHGRTLYEVLGTLDVDIPVVECVHGSHIWSEHNIYMPKRWTKHLVCVSDSAERTYLSNTSATVPTSVIINGVDTEVFNPMKALQKQSKTIAYMGRFLESDKHLKKIIKAFKSLGDFQARLHLIGGLPQEIVHLDHFVRSQKIANRVKFFEHTDKPEKHFKFIDVFTVRSEAEGYCNAVAEAMACGIPCVCYNFGGILEHVPRGTIAVGHNQQEYARLLREVHSNYALRKRMREAGIQFIQQHGGAKLMVQKYEEVIHSVLSGSKVPQRKVPTTSTSQSRSADLGLVHEEIESEVKLPTISIRTTGPVVGVCNPHWHGITTATKNICDEIVPWHKDPQVMVKNIVRYNPRAVLFSGMCPGFDRTALLMNRHHPKFPLYAYYHGGVSHYSFQSGIYGAGERNAFESMLNLHRQHVFKRIAVSSPGLAEVLRINGIDAMFCGNMLSRFNLGRPAKLDGFHIGNWNRPLDHKHVTIGIAAAQLIPNSTVHCLGGMPTIPGLDYSCLKTHGEMPQEALYEKYAQMTINLQMSFIETFNISVLEMWASGAPVITGPGNYVLYEGSEFLKGTCLVEDHTNPKAVAYAMERAARLTDPIREHQYQQLEKLSKESRSRWESFFL